MTKIMGGKLAKNGQVLPAENNPVATKRGLPVYRVNPSIPPSNGLAPDLNSVLPLDYGA
jgi:hypothetical protein